jgi:hypothetical protein
MDKDKIPASLRTPPEQIGRGAEAVHCQVRKGVDRSHEHPPQGGEALAPIKAIGFLALPHKFPHPAVAEPGGCS